jgi:hypothetical protein
VGVLIILVGIIAGIKAIGSRRKRREEDNLASSVEDIVKASENASADKSGKSTGEGEDK